MVDKFFRAERKIKPKNTFVFVIDNPHILESHEYDISELSKHVYRFFEFGAWTDGEIDDFVIEQGIKIKTELKSKVYQLTGGVPRIVKFLIFNQEVINLSIEEYVLRKDFKKLIEPTIDVVAMNKLNDLEKFGFAKNGKLRSLILEWFFTKGGYNLENFIDITIHKDLTFVENGIVSLNKLTKFEKDLLEFVIQNDNIISRDKIADLKWNDENFDKFSDQAINQAISRINTKLSKYEITAISKVGYKLIKI